jgi:hypothetical protein
VKERPILFSAPMVRALLAGAKTQTRRIIKPQPTRVTEHIERLVEGDVEIPLTVPDGWQWRDLYAADNQDFAGAMRWNCPHGRPGDRLWVKETWGPCAGSPVYRATSISDCPDGAKWKPSIFMPRWASRITLEVTEVRVERLHDISEADSRAEGVEPFVHPSGAISYRDAYARLWGEINGTFDENVWVWVVEFKRIEAQERAA